MSVILAACAEDTSGTNDLTLAESVSSNTSEPNSPTPSPKVSSGADGAEVFDLSAQDTTFLSLIEAALSEHPPPREHIYVEFVTPGGVLWQGERLTYPDKELLFLQQAETDGSLAVRWDAPSGVDQDAILSVLPEANTGEGAPADVGVQHVRARLTSEGEKPGGATVWAFDVTIAHPDAGWDDYVDGWHVETGDGQILGTRILLHPHVDEQPFTRSLSNVLVPDAVNEVRIRTHDLVSGYGPIAVTIPLDGPAAGDGYVIER